MRLSGQNSFSMQKSFFIISLICTSVASMAQQSPVSAGGDISGNGGNISYSIGQVVYTTNTGETGTITQGVQQPYEFLIIKGVENLNVHLQLSVFPNPTRDRVALQIQNYNFDQLEFQLFDQVGKLIATFPITTATTIVPMEGYSSGIYFLKVMDDSQEIKSFKIVKA